MAAPQNGSSSHVSQETYRIAGALPPAIATSARNATSVASSRAGRTSSRSAVRRLYRRDPREWSPGSQRDEAGLRGQLAGGLEHARLAEAGRSLDENDPTAALARLGARGPDPLELAFALQEHRVRACHPHEANVMICASGLVIGSLRTRRTEQ